MPDLESFTFTHTVGPDDIDRLDHVNNVAFVKIVQDAALKHWFQLAPADAQDIVTWVCRRHEIDYLKPSFLAELLHVKTWVGDPSGATWERFTEITRPADGATVLKARTVWVLLDAKTSRPRRVDAIVKGWFGLTVEGEARTAAPPET